jgi:hypothetical protein
MKFRNLFWGTILVFVGILGILSNFDVIDFVWSKLWNLWPVFLMLWGISILPVKEGLRYGMVIIVLALTLFYISKVAVRTDSDYDNKYSYYDNDDDNEDTEDEEYYNYPDTTDIDNDSYTYPIDNNDKGSGSFLIPFPENIKTAQLNLDAVAGSFILKKSTSNLATFNINDTYLAKNYTYYVKTEDNNAKVNISTKKHVNINLKRSDATAILKLNTKPIWNIEIDAGAAELNLDFSSFKVKKLNINAGAASIDIKIGDKMNFANIDVSAGAAEITLRIPKDLGCKLMIDSFLTDKDFDGFIKKNGDYYTDNYDNSDKKIRINIDSAISDLNIIRY